MFLCEKMDEKHDGLVIEFVMCAAQILFVFTSQVCGKAAAANHAAVPSPRASRIHFDWFKDAGNLVSKGKK
jgi:hypothetical protein